MPTDIMAAFYERILRRVREWLDSYSGKRSGSSAAKLCGTGPGDETGQYGGCRRRPARRAMSGEILNLRPAACRETVSQGIAAFAIISVFVAFPSVAIEYECEQ